jgi:hypothetical protein
MRPARYACVALAAIAVLAGCGSAEREISNRFGDCTFVAGTACRDQDLEAVAASNSDLAGADFSGANLTGADLRDVSFRNAILVGTILDKADLTRADLSNADLSKASLIGTNLDDADLYRTTQTDTQFCNTVMPDGSVSDCQLFVPTGPLKTPRPPQIVRAAAHRPVVCIVDGIGDGIEIDFRVRRAGSVIFSVDGARVSQANVDQGIKRIPFTCDGHPHTVSIEAFGASPPTAKTSFDVSVEEGLPKPPPR